MFDNPRVSSLKSVHVQRCMCKCTTVYSRNLPVFVSSKGKYCVSKLSIPTVLTSSLSLFLTPSVCSELLTLLLSLLRASSSDSFFLPSHPPQRMTDCHVPPSCLDGMRVLMCIYMNPLQRTTCCHVQLYRLDDMYICMYIFHVSLSGFICLHPASFCPPTNNRIPCAAFSPGSYVYMCCMYVCMYVCTHSGTISDCHAQFSRLDNMYACMCVLRLIVCMYTCMHVYNTKPNFTFFFHAFPLSLACFFHLKRVKLLHIIHPCRPPTKQGKMSGTHQLA
jgi:hypothetical protein